jgi:hypothetical protein
VTVADTAVAPSFGTVVTDRLGLSWRVRHDPYGLGLDALVGLALRDNPKRAHLVVSRVLGKHVPASPGTVRGAALLLAGLVCERLGGAVDVSGDLLADSASVDRLARGSLPGGPVVIGFCETATGLGHLLADAFDGATYVHTTRHPRTGLDVLLAFEEEHSHAVAHYLQPLPPALLDRDAPVVLVDDELTTGTTALNTVEQLLHARPYQRFVVATLLDLRSEEARESFQRRASALGVDVDVVALLDGTLDLPADVLGRAAPLQQLLRARPVSAPSVARTPLHVPWPAGTPMTARQGFGPLERAAFDRAVEGAARDLQSVLDDGPVLVLGSEECMVAAIRVAHTLEQACREVLVQSTTRSPVLPLDEAGYAIRRALSFRCPTDASRESHLYNVLPLEGDLDTYAHVVVVSDAPPADLEPLTRAVQPFSRGAVVHVTPGPQPLAGFGSYQAEDVTWLMTDLSDVDLEVEGEMREDLIQGGRPYYEMLPVEFQPDADYVALFDESLRESASRLAHAVGLVSELVLDRMPTRRTPPVLVSLARAGTPVGVLMRRWYALQGLDAPHYTISIVRGGGIDTAALDHVLARHPAAHVQFVDGWTGKGAIQRELTAALEDYRGSRPTDLSDEIAVLADPGSCTTLFGTRDDFLIPSACLNSTVSGLVSRTVYRPDLIRPGMFHGAKCYRELAPHDRSNAFVDAVSARFPSVRDDVLAAVPAHRGSDRTPRWSGWSEVTRVAHELGLDSLHLVKPGVGETTRVLLRRVPWQVLVNPARLPELEHVRVLAAARGVPLVERDDIGFSCIGVIRPKATS